MRLPRRTAAERADRLTLGLAVAAVATAGTVVGGELVKLARRRASESADAAPAAQPAGVLGSAEHALASTQLATHDTLAVAVEGYAATPRHETVLFNLFSGFVGSLALVRISTHGMRSGWWPLGNVQLGGKHIHHFVPGILVAFASGAASLLTADEHLEQTLAIPFGVGLGLTLDEAALLLELEDVYWTRDGVLSVQVSLGMAAILGGTILALRMLRRGEERAEERGAIPAAPAYSARTTW